LEVIKAEKSNFINTMHSDVLVEMTYNFGKGGSL